MVTLCDDPKQSGQMCLVYFLVIHYNFVLDLLSGSDDGVTHLSCSHFSSSENPHIQTKHTHPCSFSYNNTLNTADAYL